MSDRRQRLLAARLYLVCDDIEDSFLDAALRGGVDIVQLRCKAADDQTLIDTGRRFRQLTRRRGALLIVNDRPDLVAAIEADGVHVGQDDVPIAEARAIVGPEHLVGLSTHSAAQIDAACEAGVDYIGVGPVNETPTKPGRPAVGLTLVGYAAEHAAVPFFAIGGISGANVDQARQAGAERVAVVRALTESSDPEAAARELRRRLTAGREATVGAT